jgi:xylan 1,4-beta-xylosidase
MKSFHLCLLAAASLAAQHNPVLPGDYPDPSVIRVGKTYWATATTSHWAPIFPLLRSTDLKRWTHVGAVFQKRPDWAEINFWAPEIAEHKGRFFVYYTAKKRGGPLCVAAAVADRPDGPYSDSGPLVCEEVGSIDAVAVSDEKGARWMIWKTDGNSKRQPTPIWAQRLDDSGTKLLGERHELFRNDQPWEGQLVEGPFLLRRNGWWYAFYSGAGCCGVKCNYALGVARSRNLLGPYEKYAGNPILKASDAWKCPGHGSIVEDERGRTWLLYHAYHPEQSIWVGRQGLLDEVVWNEDGWPAVKGPTPARASKAVPVSDDFSGSLRPQWSWPAVQDAAIEVRGGVLAITPAAEEAVAALAPTAADYTAEALVEPGESAGIAAWGNAQNAVGLSADREGNLTLWHRQTGSTKKLAGAKGPAGRVHMRMKAIGGNRFAFSWSADGRAWSDIQPVAEGEHLPPWDLATRIALYAAGRARTARFDNFRLR